MIIHAYLKLYGLIFCFLIFASLLFSNIDTYAQEAMDFGIFDSEIAIEDDKNLLTSFESMFDGYLELRNFTYFQGDSSNDKSNRIESVFKLEYENDIGNIGRYFVSPKLLFDNDNYSSSEIDETEDDDFRRTSVDLEEYYVEFNFNDFDIKVGKQIFSWGRADVFNPTDNLNPRENIDLFVDEEKLGVLAFNFIYYLKDITFNFVFIPTYTPTRLPLIDSRNSFLDPEALPDINARDLPTNTFANTQSAIRISKYIAGWDVSLSYYDGFDDITLPLIEDDFSITPDYNRMRVVGLDFATTFGGLGFHGEAAQFIYDSGKDEDYFQYILGVDYTWTNIIKNHDIFVIIEYMGEKTTKSRGDDSPAFGSGLARVFTNSLLSTVNYKISDAFEIETNLLFNLDDHLSYVIKPEIHYDISDKTKLVLGVDIIEGVQETFFGQFEEDDRAYFSLRHSF